jgi:hypothetical protein
VKIGLRNEIERVAALRRKLPLLPPFKRDYALHDLAGNVVNFGELFGAKDETSFAVRPTASSTSTKSLPR